MADSKPIRISDADRDRYSNWLRLAFSEGRISEAELHERLDAVYRAKFGSELEAVTVDLPEPAGLPEPSAGATDAVAPSVDPASRAPSSVDVAGVARSVLQWYFPALICTAIWAITSFGGYFWPVWVYFGMTIPFVADFIWGGDDDDEDIDDAVGDPR